MRFFDASGELLLDSDVTDVNSLLLESSDDEDHGTCGFYKRVLAQVKVLRDRFRFGYVPDMQIALLNGDCAPLADEVQLDALGSEKVHIGAGSVELRDPAVVNESHSYGSD